MIVSGYPPAKSAGMERSCQRLSEALARRGHQVIVLTVAKGAAARDEVVNGVRVLRVIKPLAIGPLWGVTYMSQVGRWMRRLAAEWDVAVCHKLDLHSVPASQVARHRRKPVANILYNAGEWSDLRTLSAHKGGEWLLRQALRADVFFALSAASAGELVAAGVPVERIHLFRSHVDLGRYNPAGEHDPGLLLYVGRFHPQKNLGLLISAFPPLEGLQPSPRLRLIGRGPLESDLREMVAASGAADRIAIESWVEDPAAAYRAARALVMSSDAEGLANVLVEAMACGTPCVATDASGARDALGAPGTTGDAIAPGTWVEGRGGLVVARGDREGLSGALAAVLRDDALRARLSAGALDRSRTLFAEEACVADFERAIAGLLP